MANQDLYHVSTVCSFVVFQFLINNVLCNGRFTDDQERSYRQVRYLLSLIIDGFYATFLHTAVSFLEILKIKNLLLFRNKQLREPKTFWDKKVKI